VSTSYDIYEALLTWDLGAAIAEVDHPQLKEVLRYNVLKEAQFSPRHRPFQTSNKSAQGISNFLSREAERVESHLQGD